MSLDAFWRGVSRGKCTVIEDVSPHSVPGSHTQTTRLPHLYVGKREEGQPRGNRERGAVMFGFRYLVLANAR